MFPPGETWPPYPKVTVMLEQTNPIGDPFASTVANLGRRGMRGAPPREVPVGGKRMRVQPATPDGRPLLVVLRARGLAEFLTVVPVFHALATAFPGHRRVLVAPPELAPWACLCGGIDEVVPTRRLAPLPSSLHRADVAVNLHGNDAESHRVLLDTRPRWLVAFAHREVLGGGAGPQWIPREHEAERWCRMLGWHGIRANPFRLEFQRPPSPCRDVLGATVVHPGADTQAPHWPAERWVSVVRAERASNRRVLLTGGTADLPLMLQIAQSTGLECPVVHSGHTGAWKLAALVAAAGRVVCGDTVVAHLATALGTPSVLLFGSSSRLLEWGPPPHRPWHRALCSDRTAEADGVQPGPSLLNISVDDVLEALAELPLRTPVEHSVRGDGLPRT
jgi:ADP-heptose:LPS heptosyltransferase